MRWAPKTPGSGPPLSPKIKRQGLPRGPWEPSSLPSLAPLPSSALKQTLWPSVPAIESGTNYLAEPLGPWRGAHTHTQPGGGQSLTHHSLRAPPRAAVCTSSSNTSTYVILTAIALSSVLSLFLIFKAKAVEAQRS